MNTKIFKLIEQNLHLAFSLPKYADTVIDQDTVVDQLPWTPAMDTSKVDKPATGKPAR